MDLKTFAQKAKKPLCKVCILPSEIRRELEEAQQTAGVGRRMISRWLREIHRIDIGADALDKHFQAGHSDRDSDSGE